MAANYKRIDLQEARTWAHSTTLTHEGKLVFQAGFSPVGTLLAVVGYNPVTIWEVSHAGAGAQSIPVQRSMIGRRWAATSVGAAGEAQRRRSGALTLA